ncbi:bifunctional acetaldehyde-CoA/alcohol dehydrogenase [Shigella sonnei]|nr:bifunctional acetaldehyde-CoA/alcohol dehydrogenase [Shigella sonnei]
MGIVEDKVIKNHFASEYIYNAYKDEKTCGVLLNQSVLFAVSFRPLTRLQLLSSNR